MTRRLCRICAGGKLARILTYDGMPAAAQCLPSAETLHEDHPANLVVCECQSCGVVQLDNDPVPYFREVIRAAAFSPEMRVFRVAQFAELIERFELRGKKVLEIGCGRGEYLELLANSDVDAYGLEHAESAVRHCLEKNLKVARGYPETGAAAFRDAPFDAFFILSFLEHFPDPNGALAVIHESLAQGAIGVVEVPNFDFILRNNLFSEFIADHVLYFTRDTLKTTLQINGFEVLECNEVWHDYILSAVVRKRSSTSLAHFAATREHLHDELHAYVARFGEKKVAVWGAGHQALAILALANLGEKIRYVVDSAPFKQGNFTPATHIRIVDPSYLQTDPVEAIIVMAAAYTDEVASSIRERFPNTIALALLRENGLEHCS